MYNRPVVIVELGEGDVRMVATVTSRLSGESGVRFRNGRTNRTVYGMNNPDLDNREQASSDTNSETGLKKTAVQFLKFGLVGVSNTLVAWACYYLFLWINPDLYMVGTVVGGVVSIANAFFWNDRFVFKGGRNDLKSKLLRLGKTYVSYGGTSLLGIALMFIEVEFWGIDKVIAPIVNLAITVPLNFVINKFWAFRKTPAQKR